MTHRPMIEEAERRLEASPRERLKLYLGDIRAWHRRAVRFVAGESTHRPPMLPPTPRRVSRRYWRRFVEDDGPP